MVDETKNIISELVAGAYRKYFRWLELNEPKGSRSVPRGGV